MVYFAELSREYASKNKSKDIYRESVYLRINT